MIFIALFVEEEIIILILALDVVKWSIDFCNSFSAQFYNTVHLPAMWILNIMIKGKVPILQCDH